MTNLTQRRKLPSSPSNEASIVRVIWQNEHYPDIVKGGGGARNTRHITAEFCRMGIDVEILARRTPEIDKAMRIIDDVPVRYYPRSSLSNRLWLFRGLVDRYTFKFHIKKYIDTRDAYFCIDPEFVFAFKSLFPGVPVICRVEGTRAGDRQSWMKQKDGVELSPTRRLISQWLLWQDDTFNRMAWKRADGLVVKSDLICDELTNYYNIDKRKIRIIPNGVDYLHFAEARPSTMVLEQLGDLLKSNLVLCFVGRLSKVKNLAFLLKAFARLRNLERAILVVVGDGDQRLNLERECAALEIAGRVQFVGNRSDVASYLAVADVFVLTSLYETIANCLLEAMSAGVPCVALRPDRKTVRTSSDGVVIDGETGRLVGHESPDELAAVLDELLGNAPERRRLGAAGQRLVREKYDWNSCAKRYVEFGVELMHR